MSMPWKLKATDIAAESTVWQLFNLAHNACLMLYNYKAVNNAEHDLA